MIYTSQAELKDRIENLTGRKVYGPIKIKEDTTQYMSLLGGDVLRINNNDYFIMGDAYEGRFGINDQPKFWVKQSVDLANGNRKIIKLVYFEDFIMQVGKLKIRGIRSPEKESRILFLAQGHRNFMQGETVYDVKGNCVRIVDFIRGKTIFSTILDNEKSHEEFYYRELPGYLENLLTSFKAIAFLAQHGEHHGDIRNDHVIIERETGIYKWIDFDLEVNFSDYDLWSLGNLIIFAVGKGIRPIQKIANDTRNLLPGTMLTPDDASFYYPYRLANMRLIYPYILPELNEILLRFAVGAELFYEDFEELIKDLSTVIPMLRQ